MVSLNDLADRAPRVLADGEVIDLGGGKRVRFIDTPHTPHGWDAGVLFEESTRHAAVRRPVHPARRRPGADRAATSSARRSRPRTCSVFGPHPGMGATIRGLATLAPQTLALMHGPSFAGDGAAALHALADDYDRRAALALQEILHDGKRPSEPVAPPEKPPHPAPAGPAPAAGAAPVAPGHARHAPPNWMAL